MTALCWHFRNHEMKWFKPFQQFKVFKPFKTPPPFDARCFPPPRTRGRMKGGLERFERFELPLAEHWDNLIG